MASMFSDSERRQSFDFDQASPGNATKTSTTLRRVSFPSSGPYAEPPSLWRTFAGAVALKQDARIRVSGFAKYDVNNVKFPFALFEGIVDEIGKTVCPALQRHIATESIPTTADAINKMSAQWGKVDSELNEDTSLSLLKHSKLAAWTRLLFAMKRLDDCCTSAIVTLPFSICGRVTVHSNNAVELVKRFCLAQRQIGDPTKSAAELDVDNLTTWEFSQVTICISQIKQDLKNIELISNAIRATVGKKIDWNSIALSYGMSAGLDTSMDVSAVQKYTKHAYTQPIREQMLWFEDALNNKRKLAHPTLRATSGRDIAWDALIWNKVPVQLFNCFQNDYHPTTCLFPPKFNESSFDALFAISENAQNMASAIIRLRITDSGKFVRLFANYVKCFRDTFQNYLSEHELDKICTAAERFDTRLYIPNKLGFNTENDEKELETIRTTRSGSNSAIVVTVVQKGDLDLGAGRDGIPSNSNGTFIVDAGENEISNVGEVEGFGQVQENKSSLNVLESKAELMSPYRSPSQFARRVLSAERPRTANGKQPTPHASPSQMNIMNSAKRREPIHKEGEPFSVTIPRDRGILASLRRLVRMNGTPVGPVVDFPAQSPVKASKLDMGELETGETPRQILFRSAVLDELDTDDLPAKGTQDQTPQTPAHGQIKRVGFGVLGRNSGEDALRKTLMTGIIEGVSTTMPFFESLKRWRDYFRENHIRGVGCTLEIIRSELIEKNPYWCIQMNCVLLVYAELAKAVSAIEKFKLRTVTQAIVMCLRVVKLYAVQAILLETTGQSASTRAIEDAVAMLHSYYTQIDALRSMSKIIARSAAAFAQACGDALDEICTNDGFLELSNLKSASRADMWLLTNSVLHTCKIQMKVPNNHRVVIVDTMRVLRDCGFNACGEIDSLCTERAWEMDNAHMYAKLAVYLSSYRLNECDKSEFAALQAAESRNQLLQNVTGIEMKALKTNLTAFLESITGVTPMSDGTAWVGPRLERLIKEIDEGHFKQTDVYRLLDENLQAVVEHEDTPSVVITNLHKLNSLQGFSDVICSSMKFTAGIDDVIRSNLPLDKLPPLALGGAGAKSKGNSNAKGKPVPEEDSDGSDADGDDDAPAGGDVNALINDESPENGQAVWVYNEADDRIVWKEREELGALRRLTGDQKMELVTCQQLLSITADAKPAGLTYAESRLITGDSAYAKWVNNSLLVQLATALVAYNVCDSMDWITVDGSGANIHADATLLNIMYFLRNRMKIAEESDMSALIAATLVSYAGSELIKNVTNDLTNSNFDTDFRYEHIDTTSEGNDQSPAWGPNNRRLADQRLWTTLLNPVNDGDAPIYVIVEFVPLPDAQICLPNLEDMRQLHRFLSTESEREDNKSRLFPLCYCYSLPPTKGQHTAYRIVDSFHQIREQCTARVHFALFCANTYLSSEVQHRVLGNMPVRTCVVCGFVRSSTDMTHQAFEEHMYAQFYQCAINQYFDLSPAVNMMGKDEIPVSPFFRKWVKPLGLDGKLAELFNTAMQSARLKTLLALVKLGGVLRKDDLASVRPLFADLMKAPLVDGRGGELVTALQRLCNSAADPAIVNTVASIATRIPKPLDRLIRLLKKQKGQLSTTIVESTRMLNRHRELPTTTGLNSDQELDFGGKRVELVKLFVLRVCQMVLLNLPMRCMRNPNYHSKEEGDDDYDSGAAARGISDDLSIVAAISLASNRPQNHTVDYFQMHPRFTFVANDDDSDNGPVAHFTRAPPERLDSADISIPPVQEQSAPVINIAAPAPAQAEQPRFGADNNDGDDDDSAAALERRVQEVFSFIPDLHVLGNARLQRRLMMEQDMIFGTDE